ncbi:hypothetical protein B0H13DRAFT_2301818 [Mycena leptocephala]|nr:hypothetical protein B0H13DRAFT_2301818 [Mycena leptocephala]
MATTTTPPSAPVLPADSAPTTTVKQRASAAVIDHLNAQNINGPTKKHKPAVDDDVNGSVSFCDYGHTYLCIGDSFAPLDEIIQHGIFVETTEEIDLVTMTEDERVVHNHMTESWDPVASPWAQLSGGDDCSGQEMGLVSSRQEDANTFKQHVGLYIQEDPKVLVDPPINPATKIDRSFNHPLIAELFLLLKHQPTPETFDHISRRKIHITANDFPRFLFKSRAVYNKDNIEEGILEGHLLFRMAKCNLQGLASALKTAGACWGNQGNAAKMHVKKFTPRLIAYIAFQTYFALSSLESWQEVHDRFDYKKFYWNIVGLFDGRNNTHILELFNFHIFGDKSGMVAQRATKHAQLAADAATSV